MVKGYFLMGGQDISAAWDIRERVFVKEQGFSPDVERDGMDEKAVHAVIEDEDGACGTARLFYDDGGWHLGRMAVMKEKRGRGYGSLLVRMLADKAINAGIEEMYVGAQTHARGFYEKLGFRVCGEEYLEEGCPHVPMVLTAKVAKETLFGGCAGGCEGCAGCGARE